MNDITASLTFFGCLTLTAALCWLCDRLLPSGAKAKPKPEDSP